MISTRIVMFSKYLMILIVIGMVSGCASTQTTPDNPDPLEPVNRVSYDFTDTLDNHLTILLINQLTQIYIINNH